MGYTYDMQTKRFRHAFPISAYIIYALVIAVSVLSIVLASLRLSGTAGFLSVYPALDILSIVLFGAFSVFMAFIMFGTGYSVSAEQVRAGSLFFRKKAPRESLLKYVFDAQAKIGAIYYRVPDDDGIVYIVVTLRPSDREPFEAALRECFPDLLIETRTGERKE